MKQNINVLSAQEAGVLLGAHVETIRRLARTGKIPAYKVGKDWRFQKEMLLKWVKQHPLHDTPPCVLIVDDDDRILTIIGKYLENEGIEILKAADGARGLAMAREHIVDLILLDLIMPEMSGPEFLRHLHDDGFDIPCILITGYPESALVADAMRYGPVVLIAKPFEKSFLMRAVRTMLGGSNPVSQKAAAV